MRLMIAPFLAMLHCSSQISRTPLAAILIALAADHMVTAAAANDSFSEAIDLGTATEWNAAGREFVGTIEDVEGEDQEYFRFTIEVEGPIRVWTSGGFNPYLRVFNALRNPLSRWRSAHYYHPVEAGTYYIAAASSSTGRYRLHVAGGGRGHDDVGNVHETAKSVIPTQGSDEPPLDVYRIDFGSGGGGDRDFFRFEMPPGSPRWARIYTSGATDTFAWLYESCADPEAPAESCVIELESNGDSGAGDNFHIDRSLAAGTYYVGVWGHGTGPYRLHMSIGDDHGNRFDTASRAQLPSAISGAIDYTDDWDLFWFQVSTPGNAVIQTTGPVDTYGRLYDSHFIALESNNDSGAGDNFLIDWQLEPGIYYVGITDWWNGTHRLGDYTLHLSGDASGVDIVPLVPSANHPRGLWGLVRLINHSPDVATVGVTAVDDTGNRWGSFELELAGWETVNFNSNDLEYGNMVKGIVAGVGGSGGNWYLELTPSRPNIEVLAYVRTGDGPLASMHTYAQNLGRTHRVPTFNPGGNSDRASRLRLINLRCPETEESCPAANVTIFGVDDAGVRSPNVQLQIGSGAVREVTAAQLEGLESDAEGLIGRLGDGTGKWQLYVSSDLPIHVMSLLENTTGELTNLSAPGPHQVFPPAPERGATSQSDVAN